MRPDTLLLSLSTLLLLLSTAASATNFALRDICAETNGPELCVKSIESLVPSLGAIDHLTALKLLIRAGIAHTRDVRMIADKLKLAPGTTHDMRLSLQACTDGYDDALGSLKDALSAVNVNDKGRANSMLSAAVSGYEQCTDEFMGPGPNPMAPYKADLEQMAGNALTFARKVFP